VRGAAEDRDSADERHAKKLRKKEKARRKQERQRRENQAGDAARACTHVGDVPNAADVALGRQARPLGNGVEAIEIEVELLRAVLDNASSTEQALLVALARLDDLGPLSEVLLRRTRIGKVVNALTRRLAATGGSIAAGGKARALVDKWKTCVLIARRPAADDSSPGQPRNFGEVQPHRPPDDLEFGDRGRGADATAAEQGPRRGELEVTAVRFGARAQRRLARQAAAARVSGDVLPALVVEECVDLDDSGGTASEEAWLHYPDG